ncbi:translocation/assembly module TamB domain-containing protein [Terrimonas sp. NA20]|uniref:Translocation/assembly module TamB domain-containing protein n=1 Tax=Terrimonas ginsenosidimutans TaxID=2908004 RepID=A0ABS9KYD1_9BACT|nr:translocation/assembly module TamB domain-containing protein [Terrimonas ginsenosidimutans]MCG2617318.1 translocation/assembly module TamB domain-containing protein [Terrimonas ginsenosidimutans]
MSLLLLIIAVWIFIQTPFGQNWITRVVTKRLSKDLHTKIEIRKVDFSLFNNMHLEGVLVEDLKQDTLLYAGEVRVRITDWFFFKKNIELKYIGLSDAVIQLQRSDSVWNHQFLVDYFTSPSSGKSEDATQLNLKEVDLKNISFVKKDGWLGQDMTVRLSSFSLNAENIDLGRKTIKLGSLSIVDPYFALYNYQRRKPADLVTDEEPVIPVSTDSLLKWNSAGWIVEAEKLEIQNGTFKSSAASAGPQIAGVFDGKNIEFAKINTSFSGLRWEKDTVTALLNLQTRERSGLEVKSMVADVKLTPQEMSFNRLSLKTNNSIIKDHFSMHFSEFGDMNDFLHAVRMQGNFDDTQLDSDDIAFFAPEMKTWKKNITLNGVIRGAVDDLFGSNLVIQAGNNTLLNGDISMTGLPDINQTFIDFKANEFRTTYGDAIAFVPAIRSITQPDLKKLGYVRFNGNFTGFIRDFVTFGTIQTNLGTITSDLNMKLPADQQPVYSGTIASDYFKLGEFLNDSKIGVVALNGSVRGRGFNVKTLRTDLDGKIRFADYNGYRYNNIVLKGTLDKKRFEGNASIDDPEAQLTLNGVIDFGDTTVPRFNFLAEVKKANLKNLNLTNDDLAFAGKFNLNFTGNSIDNFLGYANITEASLSKDGDPLPFDSLIVSSEFFNGVKTLKAQSNEFEAKVTGNFNIRELPDAFKLFLNRYYPSYIQPPNRLPENDSLTFDITTKYVGQYVKLIDTSFSGFDNAHIYGNLRTRDNELNLNVEIPQFKYQKYNFDDFRLTAKGTEDSLSLFGSVTNINISDSLNVPLAIFRIEARNDTSLVKLYTGANQAINRANLNARVLTFDNGVKIEMQPSSFVVNSKTWTIEENGELEFRNNIPAKGQLVLQEGNQEVRMRTKPSETGDWNDLIVELKKINVGDFAPFFAPRNRIEGLVSGNLMVEDPFNNLYVSSKDIVVESARMDDDSIGNITASLSYENRTKNLKINGKTVNPDGDLAFDLGLFLGSPEEQQKNLIALKANHFQLSVLERFLGTLFTDISGFVTGDFDLRGELSKINVTGKGRLQDAGMKVIFTQCFYKIQDTDLELRSNEIPLDGIILKDTATGNPIYLTGGIQHNAFRDMFFDLAVSTRKPNTTGAENNKPVLVLNTNVNDNQQFYGRVKGTGSFSLSGPQSDIFMKIDAIASTTDSSVVTIPSSKLRESGIADFLVERKYGREMSDSSLSAGAANVTYDVDVTANPAVTVKVILDDLTGDKIEGRGNGTLNIHSGTTEKLSMRGSFDIQEGSYLFTFQSFFRKPFVIKPGSVNNISWSGDPYDAKIRFEAMYTATQVSFAPLASALSFDPAYSRVREDVHVVANLSGDLFKPDFKFHLEFPANSRVSQDFSVQSNIQQMEKNENEINRQVTYLIVFNSFAPPENTVNPNGLGSAINELTYSTISSLSGLFFNEINKKLNSELSKILKTDNVSINFSGSVYNRNLLDQQSSNNFNINQSTFNVNVPISLFNDRFIVTLGSNLDVPLQATIQQNVQFLPDVTAEWLINQSGTIRASFFYRQNLDYLTTSSTGAARTKRSGANIAYRKEFDTLGDFFGAKGKKRKKNEKDSLPQAPAILPDSTNKVKSQN